MNDALKINDISELKKYFQTIKKDYAPYIYIPITTKDELSEPEKLEKLIQGYKKSNYGGVIPYIALDSDIKPFSEEYYKIYDCISLNADHCGLSLGYIDDTYLMRTYIEKYPESSCQVLVRYESSCTMGETVKLKLKNTGDIVSVVAVNDDDYTIIDLRDNIADGVIEWKVPEGNWNIEQYVCEPDEEQKYINLMDYDISISYLQHTLKPLLDRLELNDRQGISVYIYRNINYCGQNRRIWSKEFNKLFEEMFAFDPAPYYPLLFRDFGSNAKRYKSMLMECRSNLFNNGYLKAAADYCRSKDIFCTGYPAEAKTSSCSWMFGDGQLYHQYSSAPGVAMPFAYLYGLNGIKIAAGASDIYGTDTVTADIFTHYTTLNRDIIYREAMNTYVRGVNMTFAHLGMDRVKENSNITENEGSSIWGSIFSKGDDLADFADFSARVQTMLRGGEHISEAAIVYPIHSIHSMSYLYQSSINDGFEYPDTVENEDYMEIMNNFLNYVGIDATFIHPDVISERGFSENGTMFIENGSYVMKYKILILPSMSVVSLKTLRMIKKFFDEGGKIIAVDNLPKMACEYSETDMEINTGIKTVTEEDKEVEKLIAYIFGEDCQNNRIYRMYYFNSNSNGGAAYFFPPNKTSLDRTDSVTSNILYQAVANFGFAPDVYIDKMPRREFGGILNYHLPAFLKVGIDSRLSKGCSMNYLHKRNAGAEIYYITNTTENIYNGNILLRGKLQPEEWNPYNGKIKKVNYEYVKFRNEIYTKVNSVIEPSSCIFLVSSNQRTQKEIAKDLGIGTVAVQENIKEFFPKENF